MLLSNVSPVHERRRWKYAAAVTLLISASQTVAHAEDAPEADLKDKSSEHEDLATKWKVNDADPMAMIPSVEERNQDPLEFGYYLQDMLLRAEGAYQKQDWKNAIKYYRPLAAAVPDVARSHSRLCDSYARLGEVQSAIDSCRHALGVKGARVIDHIRFTDLLLHRQSFTPVDADDIIASLDHLREHARLHPQALPGSEPAKSATGPSKAQTAVAREGWNSLPELAVKKPNDSEETARLREKALEILQGNKPEPEQEQAAGALHLPTQIEVFNCRLAVRTSDNARLTECMARLRDYRAQAEMLLPFEWADALQRKDEKRARELLEKARHSGATEGIVAGMLVEQEKAFGIDWHARLTSGAGSLVVFGGIVLALGLAFFGRRLTRSRLAASAEA